MELGFGNQDDSHRRIDSVLVYGMDELCRHQSLIQGKAWDGNEAGFSGISLV